MKLRKKKTGMIVECENIVFTHCNALALDWEQYSPNVNSLAELNEEWGDYKPTEPLIKDEKIRKAVRAWAEANRVAEARYSSCHDAECEFNARDDENKSIVFIGNFTEMNKELDYSGRTIYTIDKLCGEEE